MSSYDPQNIFAKILRGEIPCNKIAESQHSLAFYDIAPQAKHHILVIPKGAYISGQDFYSKASAAELQDFFNLVTKITTELGLDQSGYRTISNHGAHAHQEVPHMHLHIVGGQDLKAMLPSLG